MIRICVLLIFFAARFIAASSEHAIAVTVDKADLAGRKVFTTTTEGKQEIFRFRSETSVTSIAEAAINKSLYGGAGYQFIVHYQIELGEKVATTFDYVGREPWKSLTGTVTIAEPDKLIIAIKTQEGSEERFQTGKHFAIETDQGTKVFAAWANSKPPEAAGDAIIRYTEIRGQKVAHLLEYRKP